LLQTTCIDNRVTGYWEGGADKFLQPKTCRLAACAPPHALRSTVQSARGFGSCCRAQQAGPGMQAPAGCRRSRSGDGLRRPPQRRHARVGGRRHLVVADLSSSRRPRVAARPARVAAPRAAPPPCPPPLCPHAAPWPRGARVWGRAAVAAAWPVPRTSPARRACVSGDAGVEWNGRRGGAGTGPIARHARGGTRCVPLFAPFARVVSPGVRFLQRGPFRLASAPSAPPRSCTPWRRATPPPSRRRAPCA